MNNKYTKELKQAKEDAYKSYLMTKTIWATRATRVTRATSAASEASAAWAAWAAREEELEYQMERTLEEL